MKSLLIAAALILSGLTLDSGIAVAAKAGAKCDYAGCVQRCNLNRGRYCASACRHCQ
jgi:hypothetical protein